MNPLELNAFIEEIYLAGPSDRNGQQRLLEFAQQPGTVETILNGIESGQLSRNSVLVCLSVIPCTSGPGGIPHSSLRDWFRHFALSKCSLLAADPQMMAMTVNVYRFIYGRNQLEGAELIQELSQTGPYECFVAIKIAQAIIEKNHLGKNVKYMVPVAADPLKREDCPKELLIASIELLLAVLENKRDQHWNRLAVLKLVLQQH